MSKMIRIDEKVYDQLDSIRDWKESFSLVIARLLKVYKTIYEIREILGPGHYLMERPSTDARAKETAHR